MYRCSTLIARASSWNLRWNVCDVSPVMAFFTSCCVIVEPPWTTSPVAAFVSRARMSDVQSSGPCS